MYIYVLVCLSGKSSKIAKLAISAVFNDHIKFVFSNYVSDF